MSDPEPIDLSQLQNLSLAPDWVGDLQKREAAPGDVPVEVAGSAWNHAAIWADPSGANAAPEIRTRNQAIMSGMLWPLR